MYTVYWNESICWRISFPSLQSLCLLKSFRWSWNSWNFCTLLIRGTKRKNLLHRITEIMFLTNCKYFCRLNFYTHFAIANMMFYFQQLDTSVVWKQGLIRKCSIVNSLIGSKMYTDDANKISKCSSDNPNDYNADVYVHFEISIRLNSHNLTYLLVFYS